MQQLKEQSLFQFYSLNRIEQHDTCKSFGTPPLLILLSTDLIPKLFAPKKWKGLECFQVAKL